MTDTPPAKQVSLSDFQLLIRRMYYEKDVARGVEGTFMWLMEEVGELATALRNGSHEERVGEFADVLAWLTTIANVVGVDLTEAVSQKYGAAVRAAAVSFALARTPGNHDGSTSPLGVEGQGVRGNEGSMIQAAIQQAVARLKKGRKAAKSGDDHAAARCPTALHIVAGAVARGPGRPRK